MIALICLVLDAITRHGLNSPLFVHLRMNGSRSKQLQRTGASSCSQGQAAIQPRLSAWRSAAGIPSTVLAIRGRRTPTTRSAMAELHPRTGCRCLPSSQPGPAQSAWALAPSPSVTVQAWLKSCPARTASALAVFLSPKVAYEKRRYWSHELRSSSRPAAVKSVALSSMREHWPCSDRLPRQQAWLSRRTLQTLSLPLNCCYPQPRT